MFKWLSNFLRGTNDKNQVEQAKTDVKKQNSDHINTQKIWKKELEPVRQLVLWGWGKDNQPSLLFLYGKHEFAQPAPGGGNILNNEVTFSSYAVFDGGQGHLPSFPAVKLIEQGDYYERKRKEEFPKLYYKTGLKGWRKDNDYLVEQFTKLGNNSLTLPYFAQIDYEQLVEKISGQVKNFTGFSLAKTPNDILQLTDDLAVYYPDCCQLLGHANLYMRKKALQALLAANPPQQLWQKLATVGSTEMLAGLFLELARQNNGILLAEAQQFSQAETGWAGKNYDDGLKRCANIYLNALQPQQRKLRTEWLKKHINEIDLPLVSLRGKKLPPDKVLEGINYRRYSLQGYLHEYTYDYDYKKRESIKKRVPEMYKPNHFNDGVCLNTLALKNFIQEAESLQLADVIGQVAYYLDAPRLTYYFKGNGKGRELRYYQKYVRRIIDGYAKNSPALFMQAMSSLLTSYTPADYVCKFPGNFQFNYFIKHYLYYSFTEKAPYGWDNWHERQVWMADDQLMEQEGRYEYAPEIWENSLPEVVEIALKSQIDTVAKACYNILKNAAQADFFLQNLPYLKLVQLSEANYTPLALLAAQILKQKLEQTESFDASLMLALLSSKNQAMHKTAQDYQERTKGRLLAGNIAGLLFLTNLENLEELLQSNLLTLTADGYADFVLSVLAQAEALTKAERKISKQLQDILAFSTAQLKQAAQEKKREVLQADLATLVAKPELANWLQQYFEESIFVLDNDELQTIAEQTGLLKQLEHPAKASHVIALLGAIQTVSLPSDAQLVNILEKGSAKTISSLIQLVELQQDKLGESLPTLLILLETQVASLNEIAKNTFTHLPEQRQSRMHQMIIDSPVESVYLFGLAKADEFYRDALPETFIKNMLEHPAPQVRAYIADKAQAVFDSLANGNEQTFIYYAKTVILSPNKLAQAKNEVYKAIPRFAAKYPEKTNNLHELLKEIGGSNVRADAERALTTLAQMRKEAV